MCDLCVELADARVCRVKSWEGVTSVYKSFGSVSQVGDRVGDMAAGDVSVGGGCEDPPEALLPGTAGGGQLQIGEDFLCLQV